VLAVRHVAMGVLEVAPIQDLTINLAHYGALAVDLEDDLVANRVLELVGRSKLAEGSCQPALRPYARAPTSPPTAGALKARPSRLGRA